MPGELAEQRAELGQPGGIARSHGAEPGPVAAQNGRDDLQACDAGATQNPPTYFVAHFISLPGGSPRAATVLSSVADYVE
jgi:hypothetical protein